MRARRYTEDGFGISFQISKREINSVMAALRVSFYKFGHHATEMKYRSSTHFIMADCTEHCGIYCGAHKLQNKPFDWELRFGTIGNAKVMRIGIIDESGEELIEVPKPPVFLYCTKYRNMI